MSAVHQDLADANLVASIREHARWQDPVDWVEEGGVLLLAGPNDYPGAYRNCAVRTDPGVSALEVLERARAFFEPLARGFTVFVRESRDGDLETLLQQRGLRLRADSPCMLIDTPVVPPVVAGGMRLDRWAEKRHIADAAKVVAEAFHTLGMPPAETAEFFAYPQQLLRSSVAGFVAYRDKEPLSTALTILSGASAGVYWVATAPSARRRGLGDACTRLATNAGFASGAQIVTLQASPYGEPVYRRLGYRTYDRMRWYVQAPR